MSSMRYLGIGLLALVVMGGCESTPTATRTGGVRDIVIGDKLFAAQVSVNPGDEVRWVNTRRVPVRIVFLNPVSDKQLSCKNNFGGVLTPSGTANLATNQTASACFQNPGSYPYIVRMEGTLTTGEILVPGIIQVGG
jgi:plastocyanin